MSAESLSVRLRPGQGVRGVLQQGLETARSSKSGEWKPEVQMPHTEFGVGLVPHLAVWAQFTPGRASSVVRVAGKRRGTRENTPRRKAVPRAKCTGIKLRPALLETLRFMVETARGCHGKLALLF